MRCTAKREASVPRVPLEFPSTTPRVPLEYPQSPLGVLYQAKQVNAVNYLTDFDIAPTSVVYGNSSAASPAQPGLYSLAGPRGEAARGVDRGGLQR